MPSLIPPGGRRRRSICCIVFLVLVFVGTAYYPSASPYLPQIPDYYRMLSDSHAQYVGGETDGSTSSTSDEDPDFPLDSAPDNDNVLCEPDDCVQGSWVPRDPPLRSLDDFRKKYPASHRGIFKICGSDEEKREPEDHDRFHKAQEERLVRTMNWVWKPIKGRMREWDAIEFVVRLLKSPGGIIFSGDSITRQHFQWLEYALARADIYITEDPPHLPSYSHKRLHQFVLRPGDPMTAYLQDRAGVPDSRLRRPIYVKIDNHILIGEKEVRQFSAPLGAKEGFPWYNIFDYFEDWEIFVRDAAKARDGEENVTEDTVLVLNTGPHWSRGAWYMLPNTGDVPEQQSRVTMAFKKMIELITSRLDPTPQLSIYYRATAPGHPACPSSTFYNTFLVNSTIVSPPSDNKTESKRFIDKPTFYTDPHPNVSIARLAMSDIRQGLEASTIDSQQKVVRSRWDWDRLEVHNAEWKQAIDDLIAGQKTPERRDNSKRAKWYYMDIWDMALQRPDAHTQNLVDPKHENYDCLHWCVPGVVEQWTEYLNHLIFWDANGRS
ncbi:hypothetical protein P691DRAFT_732731 [Macrolepiota fuliginosa MF-IS2]|uniref:Trichome birefringence-like C-terminal domain-containing protein n=1 Tax=Macrolepiota fuliginosa MF-IS2 TaxID=1400762 RepID=A0A9P6BZW4_9AGAR|nr:hypothetical protein P691DRAFT_732731 [Macrolepiota fuliginosa MF-IS2]